VFKDPASVVYTSLEGKRVSLLIYETTDTDFADTAIEALAGAGISSHRTGAAIPVAALIQERGLRKIRSAFTSKVNLTSALLMTS
jgi:hypothetical protein